MVLSINALAATVSTDIVKTGLTLAPSSNNTALVNNTNITNNLYAGEVDSATPEIIIDAVGSEISDRVGQYVGLKTATGEIMYAYVKSATLLTNVFRGFFFDDGGVPIARGNLSNNDTLTLINLGWVFVEDNGTTVDVTYDQPVYSFEAPSGPNTGQYWFDITNQTWKRYSGIQFDIINRTLIGMVALDGTDAIASRAADFSNSFSEYNNIEVAIDTTEIILGRNFESITNVYGTVVVQNLNKLSWNITTDLESPLTEAVSTDYYLYLSTEGERIISTERPHLRDDLKGKYHPFNSWRCVGGFYNDSSSDIIMADEMGYNSEIKSRYSQVRDERNDGSNGGAASAATNHVRILNVQITNDYIVNMDNNIAFLHKGEYRIKGSGPANAVDDHRVRLHNLTDTEYVIEGENTIASATGSTSNLRGIIKIDVSKEYQLVQWTNTAKTGNGLGGALAIGDGSKETYGTLETTKIG